MRTQLPLPKGAEPRFSVHVCYGQTTAGWIKMPLGTEVVIGPGNIVLVGERSPPQKTRGQQPPTFGPCIVAKRLDRSKRHLVRSRPRPRPHCVRRRLSSPPPPPKKKGHSPQFSSHVCCGQMAGLVKMPLGTEVGIGPGHIVLDRDHLARRSAVKRSGVSNSTAPNSAMSSLRWRISAASAGLCWLAFPVEHGTLQPARASCVTHGFSCWFSRSK